MATGADWVEGARPRTLYLALAPVVAGTGVAAFDSDVRWARALLALVVSLAMQVGVNYANDYSDGVRGADADRVGPMRLVGSGAAAPRAVLIAAVSCFALAAVTGLVLAALTTWWLLAVGAAAILAAWGYTGGPLPYGYRALGEIAVFAFFGLVAVIGTAYVQTERVTGTAIAVAVPIGLLACAVLVANNLRDIPGDTRVGKHTLAVIVGARASRGLYAVMVLLPFAITAGLALKTGSPAVLLTLLALPLAGYVLRPVVRGASGRDLIPTLRGTGQLTLAVAVLIAAGLWLAG
jgi:1,4-dihydroxy-2-naphthoate octaprenyltransferase